MFCVWGQLGVPGVAIQKSGNKTSKKSIDQGYCLNDIFKLISSKGVGIANQILAMLEGACYGPHVFFCYCFVQ